MNGCRLKQLLSLVGLGLFSMLAVNAQNVPKLLLDQSMEQEIKGGQVNVFTVDIPALHTARIVVEQNGIDVSLAAVKPTGERFIESESPSGMRGTDWILVTAPESGEYKIEVMPADPRAPNGRFSIKLIEVRPTVPRDLEINNAGTRITKLAGETVAMRQSGTREGRRLAIANFSQIIELSKIREDRVWELVGLLTSGLIYEQLGEIQNALSFYQRGLTLAREIGHRQYEGSALNNLAVSYNAVGEYQQGIFYLEQALALQRESGNPRAEAISLNNLGMSYLLLNDFEKARNYFERSLPLRREVKDQRGEGTTLNNLGNTMMRSGDLANGIVFMEQSLALRRSIGERAGEAISLRNLGTAYWQNGEKAKSVENFTAANRLARELGDRRVEADSFYWLAIVERDRGEIDKAITNLENGLKIIEQIRGELVNPELRTAYFSTVQDFYELYTDLLVSRFEKTKAPTDAEAALETSERARSRSLVELLQEARIDVRRGVSETLLEREVELQDLLNAKYRQRTQLLAGKPTPEQSGKILTEINSLASELEALRVKIRLENPRYAGLKTDEPVSAKSIRELLDDETVLLEYKLGSKRSFLWLVTKDGTELFVLPARSAIEADARSFYGTTVSRAAKSPSDADVPGARLSRTLLSPVLPKIKGKRVAIVADGVLQLIPFAALAAGTMQTGSQPARLIDQNEIVVLPSAGVLSEIRRFRKEGTGNQKTLAVFADAVFDAGDSRLAKSQKNEANSGSPQQVLSVLRDFDGSNGFSRLLSSRVEARNIATIAGTGQADLNIDFDASRGNVLETKLDTYRILHFATHGLLDTTRPEYSGLVLSLFDREGKAVDGYLRLSQIYNLDLNSDLVVLSACQTALGKDVRGEGIVGLTRGFIYAGTKRVVASLWKVDDAATAEFMKRFYQQLLQKKQRPVAALRAAQLEMKQIPRYRSPYFWAGFTIQGEWR